MNFMIIKTWINLCIGIFVFLPSGTLLAQNPSAPKSYSSNYYPELVRKDKPVAYWRMDLDNNGMMFNSVATAPELRGKLVGEVEVSSGPTGPEHPKFGAAENTALEIPNAGGHITVDDPGDNSPLDFTLGDSITIEAWVQLWSVGGYRYIVGKGRTGNPEFPAENHNYSLRIAERVRFHFSIAASIPKGNRTITAGRQMKEWEVSDGWHHIALTYTFGKTKSIRGYIDGKPVSGKWDMAGDTGAKPVVDNDQLWIGSALSANPNSTLKGPSMRLRFIVKRYQQKLCSTIFVH